jgi:uncharacterized protein
MRLSAGGACVVAFCVLLPAGCGFDGSDGVREGLPSAVPTPTDLQATSHVVVPTTHQGVADADAGQRKLLRRIARGWLQPVLNKYWIDELDRLFRVEFDPPDSVVAYRGDEAIRCGHRAISMPQGAFYCYIDGDEKVAFDLDWMASPWSSSDGGMIYLVLAHEWGHAVQDTLQEQHLGKEVWRPSYRRELNADCLAGSFFGYHIANLTFDIDPDDPLGPVWDLIARSGSSDWTDPGDHGTSEQRQRAFLDGYLHGIDYCQNTY